MQKRLKIGDFVTPPNTRNANLTPHKKYEIIEVTELGTFFILNDSGREMLCKITDCAHLNGGDWILDTSGHELKILNIVQGYCEESLDPDTFSQWQNVKKQLMKNRKIEP